MTTVARELRSRYDFHGIAVAVHAPVPAVIEAMDLRLRAFGDAPDMPAAEVRLEFVLGGAEPPAAVDDPISATRPVYDTPYGSLHYHPETDLLSGELRGVRLWCEAGRGLATLESRDFTGRDLYLATHPLATISLMELLKRHRLFCLHAGCVADAAGQGVLLAGPSGAGKSTLAVSLALTGLAFLSDDLVFLEPDGSRVLGFADALGLTPRAAEHLDAMRAQAPAAGFPKPLGRIENLTGRPALSECSPVAIVFPEIAPNEPSRLAPLPSAEALLRLVPDVLLTQPEATQSHLGALASLLDRVQCYELRSGHDLDRAVALVGGLL